MRPPIRVTINDALVYVPLTHRERVRQLIARLAQNAWAAGVVGAGGGYRGGYREGYDDGYAAGWDDGQHGVDLGSDSGDVPTNWEAG